MILISLQHEGYGPKDLIRKQGNGKGVDQIWDSIN
jgi:hypothetical protein